MSDDVARLRFFMLNAVRVAGVVLVLLGILAARGVVDLPRVAAYAVIAVGLIDVFVVPQVLARRWRTPR